MDQMYRVQYNNHASGFIYKWRCNFETKYSSKSHCYKRKELKLDKGKITLQGFAVNAILAEFELER